MSAPTLGLFAGRKLLALGLLALPLLGGALFVRVRWEQERARLPAAAHPSHGSRAPQTNALLQLKQRAEALPNNPEAQAQLAMALLAAGQAGEADITMRQAVRLAPDQAPFRLGLARIRIATGDEAGARESAAAAERLAGEEPRLLVEVGKLYQDLDRYPEALRLFEKAVQLAPRSARPRLFLGQFLLMLDSPGEALEHFREAARHEPELAGAHLACADAALRMGRLEEAAKAADRAIALQSDSAEALQVRALIYLEDSGVTDATEKARGLLERAARLAPEDALIHYNLGRAALRMGDAEAAASAFEQTVHRNPQHLAARMNLARAYQRLGRTEEAAQRLKEVQPLLETSLDLTQLQTRVRRNPGDADAHYRIGRIFLAQGQREVAQRRFRKALLAHPGHTAARKALSEMGILPDRPGGALE